MPKTKFQEVIFTILMVMVMVYAMVVYNIAFDKGGMSNQIFLLAFHEFPIMVIAGFILELFVVGRIVPGLAFRIVTPGKDRPIAVILVISALTVCFMCPIMSFIATVLFQGVNSDLIANWLQISVRNFPMALCWQIFYAGPLVRWIFGKIFRQSQERETATAA